MFVIFTIIKWGKMKQYTIYHNPRCSKSRNTLQILNDNDVNVEIKLYLENPPPSEELSKIGQMLHKTPMEFIRNKEDKFKELNLKSFTGSDNELFQIMSENPKLIERPIVVCGNNAIIGRPPENVNELL
jgi:arsenate reductase